MKITSKLVLGTHEYVFEVEEGTEMDALHKAIVLSNPRTYCDECGNANKAFFALDSNKDKEGNTYVNNTCLNKGCFAKSKLGQYKTKGYFWHKFEKYSKDAVETK